MSLLFETIKVKNNSLLNLDYHNARVNKSRKELYNAEDNWDISQMINLPVFNKDIVYKCRFIYEKELVSIEFQPYSIRQINTLKLLVNEDIEYNYKYFNRNDLDVLKWSSQQTDEIIIVKNNRLTDISYANIAFFDGSKWFTPATPLLKGTKRQKYIEEQVINEAEIAVNNLYLFRKARIINAMIDLDESPDIRMENIS